MSWFARRRDALQRLRSGSALQSDAALDPPPPPPPLRTLEVGEGVAVHRILLLSTGPAAGWGAADQWDGLGGALAEALHLATGRRIVVDVLVDDRWEERDAVAALRSHDLTRSDALVMAAVYYRPALIEVPLDDWQRTTEYLRDSLLSAIGAGGLLLILQLPWRDAAARDPERWGAETGRRIEALTRVAQDALDGFRQIRPLLLHPPADAEEWREPGFSVGTYRAWGVEAALALLPHLRAGAPSPDDRRPTAGSTTPSISETR